MIEVGQHQMVAGDMNMRRLQDEPVTLLLRRIMPLQQCYRCRRAVAALVAAVRASGGQTELLAEPVFMRQGARKRVVGGGRSEVFATAQQGCQRRCLALAQQLARHFSLRQTERQEDIEMIHAAIVGENFTADSQLQANDAGANDVVRLWSQGGPSTLPRYVL
jgi:hypothetical protein